MLPNTDYRFTILTAAMTSVIVLGYAKQHKAKNIKIYGSIISRIFLVVTPTLSLPLPTGPMVGVLF
jgi:hypothetical protein